MNVINDLNDEVLAGFSNDLKEQIISEMLKTGMILEISYDENDESNEEYNNEKSE